jgi:hypothetical protein
MKLYEAVNDFLQDVREHPVACVLNTMLNNTNEDEEKKASYVPFISFKHCFKYPEGPKPPYLRNDSNELLATLAPSLFEQAEYPQRALNKSNHVTTVYVNQRYYKYDEI